MFNSYFDEARELTAKLTAWRRHLHQFPELSFNEYNTQAFIMAELQNMGIQCSPIADTGVLAIIGSGPACVALRGDMDALPISESNNVDYISRNPGIMHACGHDAHTACLLGAAALLKKSEARLNGTVRLLFQPGEEKLPGGATKMISAGALGGASAIFGLHVTNELPVGTFGTRSGMYMASTDEIYITLRGRGGHGALPHTLCDTVLMQAQVIVALQQIVARRAKPDLPTVLSFGRVEALGATNVIPDKVELQGTIRTFNEEWREYVHTLITEIAGNTAHTYGGEADINIVRGYPFLQNDEVLHADFCRVASAAGGISIMPLALRTTAEDFAWYSHEIPAYFFRLGTGNAHRGVTASVHSSNFDIDESALPYGAAMMAAQAEYHLSKTTEK